MRRSATKVYTRLGLYAEKLMAFYYQQHGQLVAHGLQVRATRNDTVGEFDFLLDAGPDGVEHIEFATKFYLLEGSAASRFDTFVGPNLADSLGAKMRKIVDKQLALASHPAAQALLPRPVLRARALVKGWLFYPAASCGADGRHRGGPLPRLLVPAGAGRRAGGGRLGGAAAPRVAGAVPGGSNDAMLTREGLQAALAQAFETLEGAGAGGRGAAGRRGAGGNRARLHRSRRLACARGAAPGR